MFFNNVICCCHVYYSSLLVFPCEARDLPNSPINRRNIMTRVSLQNRFNLSPGSTQDRLRTQQALNGGDWYGDKRGGIQGAYPFLYFDLLPVYACSADNRYVNKLVYLTSRIMSTASFFQLQTSQSTDETLSLKKNIFWSVFSHCHFNFCIQ